jgi:hypothetical protein
MNTNTRRPTWLTLLALAACDTGGGGDGASAEDAGSADAGEVDARVSLECIDEDYPGEDWLAEPEPPVVSAEWTDSRTLVVTISSGAELGPYYFGLVENAGSADGWDGEDCIDGVLDDHDFCHMVPADGVLTLTSVHPDEGGTIEELQEDVTTLMNAARAPGLTYVLIRATEDANCWTWGHDPQFYIDELGCNTYE